MSQAERHDEHTVAVTRDHIYMISAVFSDIASYIYITRVECPCVKHVLWVRILVRSIFFPFILFTFCGFESW